MSLLVKGVSKLSQIEIDANKDWQAKEITNLKAIVADMVEGDLPYRGSSVMDRLPKVEGLYLKQGPLAPLWSGVTGRPLFRFVTLLPGKAVLPTTNPAALTKTDGTNFTYNTLDFDPTTEQSAYWVFNLSPDYANEDIMLLIRWKSTATTGDVKFGISVLGREEGEMWDAALGTEQTAVTTAPDVAGELAYSSILPFSPNWSPRDTVIVKLARKTGDDTMAADALVTEVFLIWATSETVVAPTMVTHDADEITATGAKLHGEVFAAGFEPPARYFDWISIPDWLSPYDYRQQITINATAAGAQTNYQMKLTVHKGLGDSSGSDCYLKNHAKNWPNDIRFTKPDGTLLDYWLESSDENTATVWIEFDSIPASGSVNFYIYYGETEGASASDFDATRKPISTIAEVCDDIAHASATNIKAVLEGAGYTVTLVTDDDVVNDVVDLSGYDMIVCVRTQFDLAGLGAKLRGYCDNHIPLMAGMEAGITLGIHTDTQLVAMNYTARVRADNSEDEVVITNNSHYITSVFSLGDLTIATANEFLESIEKANSVGASLADRKGYTDYSGIQVIEAATLDLSAVAFGQRVCHIGFLYRNTAADGNTLILRGVKWTGFRNYVTPEPTWGAWGEEEAGFTEEDCGVGGIGLYEKAISGLTPNTKYYFKARGVNSGGTGVGVMKEFTTLAA